MALNFEGMTIKNFMSVGNVTQAVSFTNSELFLILGENRDLGGDDNRNGAGKTALGNSLCYALYGKALSNGIKMDNLINKTNGKGMYCTVNFNKDGKQYRIERGRRPSVLKFFIDDNEVLDIDETDDNNEARGEMKNTQTQITKVLDMPCEMFKNIVAMTTYTDPFLKMRPIDQREIIEELLGVTQLSEKAAKLTEMKRETKDDIKYEEMQINAIKTSNDTFQKNINSLQTRSIDWANTKDADIARAERELIKLDSLDIDTEIANQKILAEQDVLAKELANEVKNHVLIQRQHALVKKNINTIDEELERLAHSEMCPTCDQEIDSDVKAKLVAEYTAARKIETDELDRIDAGLAALTETIDLIKPNIIENPPEVNYRRLEDALDHKNKVNNAAAAIERLMASENPYTEQIQQLTNTGIKEINYDELNSLSKKLDHEEYLFKLLNNKDSFIRKKVINQNLHFLNTRLKHYLMQLGLPHTVVFQSDLSVEIEEHGRELDFDNLSRGERTRLSLGLGWGFRDVHERLHSSINLMFIDELLDNGLDLNGVESALSCLKHMVRSNNKCVHLISHRDELVGRVNNTIRVIKENGFTSIQENG